MDLDLEKWIFAFSWSTLAEIRSKVVVDEFTTVAEYIKPDASQLKIDDMLTKDKKWLSEHVRTSKYMS
jgi:hypothetical protein